MQVASLPASTGRRPGPRQVLPPRGRGGGRPCTDSRAELAHLERDEDGKDLKIRRRRRNTHSG